MLPMVRDYLLILFGKLFFMFLAFVAFVFCAFVGYSFFCGFSRAYFEIYEILTCPAMRFFVGLVVFGCLFHTAEYKSSPKKFDTNAYLDRVFFEHDTGNRMF